MAPICSGGSCITASLDREELGAVGEPWASVPTHYSLSELGICRKVQRTAEWSMSSVLHGSLMEKYRAVHLIHRAARDSSMHPAMLSFHFPGIVWFLAPVGPK